MLSVSIIIVCLYAHDPSVIVGDVNRRVNSVYYMIGYASQIDRVEHFCLFVIHYDKVTFACENVCEGAVFGYEVNAILNLPYFFAGILVDRVKAMIVNILVNNRLADRW